MYEFKWNKKCVRWNAYLPIAVYIPYHIQQVVALPQPRDSSVVFAGWRQCAPHSRIYRKPKMFAMATSVFAGYRQYLHFVGRPLKPPACLVAVVHTKPLIASLVPKLVAMATSLRISISDMSSSDSLTPKTHNRIKYRAASYHTTEIIAHRKPKSGCHDNVA